tara:strand:- start:29 stop:217 length:189 start_codon:yes stop_codon:yes gene_type:complete
LVHDLFGVLDVKNVVKRGHQTTVVWVNAKTVANGKSRYIGPVNLSVLLGKALECKPGQGLTV